jgi:hypothetical protein
MHALKNMTVGVSSQAAIIFTLTALWWVSMFRDALWGYPSFFWVAVCYSFPFVMLVFAAILSVSYKRASRPNRWLFRLAMLSALSPWFLFLAGFVSFSFPFEVRQNG